MDRRKDTVLKSTKLPPEYISMIQRVFDQNFRKELLTTPSEDKKKGPAREKFIVFGEIFPDELILVVSLKHPDEIRMTTCYASIDYPPPQFKKESGKPVETTSEVVKYSVERCVDAAASFFNTYFSEGRPLDYEQEYRQKWTPLEIEKNCVVHLQINRDNLELEAEADKLLEKAPTKAGPKKSVH